MTTKKLAVFVGVASLALALAQTALGQGWGHSDDRHEHEIRHVLLVSIDGMHAVDFENCVASGTCPTLGALGHTGVTYTRTTTSRPSDSFPGLMALVTGGSPKTVARSTTSLTIVFWPHPRRIPATVWHMETALQE
jgi:Type I phosphodiesterase / nucleotide pyrophosphatase